MKRTIYTVIAILVLIGIAIGGYILTQNQNTVDQKKETVSDTKEPETNEEDTKKTFIGIIRPVSGDYANLGEIVQRGINMSFESANIKDIEFVTIDSKCEKERATEAATTLIEEYNVVAIIGDICSEATFAAAQVAQEYGVVLISPAATTPALSKLQPYTYRTIPSDTQQGAWVATLVYERGFRKVGFIVDNTQSSNDFVEGFTNKFTQFGGKVVTQQTYESNQTSFNEEVAAVFSYRPDIAYIISSTPKTSIAIVSEFHRQGPNLPLYGSGAFRDQEFLNETGAKAESLVNVSVSLGVLNFAQNYLETYEELPGLLAAQGYDAFVALALTFINGAKTNEDIANLLPQVKFDGASGYVEFNKNGDVPGNYTIFEVIDGKFVQTDRDGTPIPITPPENTVIDDSADEPKPKTN